MDSGTPTHYVVVEGLAGEDSTWRVVRAEEHARGRRLYAFVGTCQTRRAALSLARALNEKRAVDDDATRRGATGAAAPTCEDPYRLRPLRSCALGARPSGRATGRDIGPPLMRRAREAPAVGRLP